MVLICDGCFAHHEPHGARAAGLVVEISQAGRVDEGVTGIDDVGKPLNPGGWQIPGYRCITLTEMGRLDEALADCNEVLAQHPKFSGPLARRANVYRAKGDLDAALRDFNEALKLSPNFVYAYVGRGQLHEQRKDMVAARADYRSAGAALNKIEEYETALARRFAKERLAALVAADPSLRSQTTGPVAPPAGKLTAPAAPQ